MGLFNGGIRPIGRIMGGDMNTYRAVLPALALGLWASVAAAVNGDIDPTFGNAGIALTGVVDALGNGAYGPVVQPDGKILICDTRTANGSSGRDFFVARFNTDGSLDTSFSFDGKVTIDFDGGTGLDVCTAIALQGDGKIVVAGYTVNPSTQGEDFAVARLDADGTLDTTFGPGTGKVTVPFDLGDSNSDEAAGVAVQADGKIVVAGSVKTASHGLDFGIARLLGDGTLDAAFNLTGKVTIGFDLAGSTSMNDRVAAVAIDAQQRIVVAGSAAAGNATPDVSDFAIARVLPNGQPDPNFDADGRTTIAFDVGASTDDQAFGMTIQHDGRIVLVGAADTSPTSTQNYNMAVARVTPDGSPDASFGIGGKTLVPFDLVTDGTDAALSVAEEPDGRLLMVGYAMHLPTGEIAGAAARMNADGSLDNGFGSFGKQFYDFGLTSPSAQVLRGVAIDGTRIISSGAAVVPGGTNAIDDLVVRLEDDLIFANGFE